MLAGDVEAVWVEAGEDVDLSAVHQPCHAAVLAVP